MACGTPVLAFDNGAVPEVVDPGVTGYVVRSVGEAVCKIGGVLALDRGQVRRRFEERFTATRMTRDYVNLYASLLEQRPDAMRTSARTMASQRIAPKRISPTTPERTAAGGLREVIPIAAAGEPGASS
jgi:hypothetical protein